jgi:hypothetical protein
MTLSSGWLSQAVQIIGGALRMRGRGEDRALIFFEDLEPVGDIARVIFARFGRDPEIDAKESGAKLANEFLGGVAFIAPALAAESRLRREACLVQCVSS